MQIDIIGSKARCSIPASDMGSVSDLVFRLIANFTICTAR